MIGLLIEPGAPRDFAALEHLHYRAGRPAPPVAILRATLDGELAGVLVVSMPTLNGPWRTWLRAHGRDAARELNASLRTISRVVVDPRFRSLGIAAALVRAYLASPRTPRTEAIASIARAAPIFAAAGMRALPLPPTRRDLRLARALRDLHVEPHRLADLRFLRRRARDLAPALRAWSIAHRATRDLADGPLPPLAARAAERLTNPRTVFVHP